MSNPSNSTELECSVCGRVHSKNTFLPCSHNGLCLDCIGRLPHPRCPFCRTAFHRVQTEKGVETYGDLRSEYVALEKRDLRNTIQICLVGPNMQDTQSVLDGLLEHGQHDVGKRESKSKYSANCSFNNSESNLTVHPVPQRIGLWSNTESDEADVIAILMNDGDDGKTYERFRDCHLKVMRETSASVVWLLKHDGNSVSGCGIETVAELVKQDSQPDIHENISEVFMPLVQTCGSRKWTRDEAGRVHSFLCDVGQFHKMKKHLWE